MADSARASASDPFLPLGVRTIDLTADRAGLNLFRVETVVFRTAVATDAAAIATLHVASWRDAYATILDPDYLDRAIESDRFDHWAKMIGSGSIVELAEDKAGRLLGFVCVFPDADPERGSWVDNLHVLPADRGRGIGERLLRRAARLLQDSASRRDLHLWVFEMNEAAIRFYARLGGEVIDTMPSRIPAARGKTIVCIHWPDLGRLASSE